MNGIRFSAEEVRDLAVAWVVLGVAFAIFFLDGGTGVLRLLSRGAVGTLLVAVGVSLVTAGIAFLFHELGHKVVAIRFGNIAHFRADYGMLFLAVMSALVGFLFAAPGAVYHRGRTTARENGLIALAGPAVNVLLAALFIPILVLGTLTSVNIVSLVGARGIAINLFLAAFNLVPYGPLDGRTVLSWNTVVWASAFLPTAALAVFVVFILGIGF